MADTTDGNRIAVRVLIAIAVAIAIVLLLAYARGEPGIDGRTPDSDEVVEVPPGEDG
jgi:hypothetical protein